MAGTTRQSDDDARPQNEPVPWTRAYPPLLVLVAGLLAAIVLLPSALNLPQANPSTTLEYAPVPPQDKSPTVAGNLSAFGSAQSGTLAAPTQPPAPLPPKPPGGTGARPRQKRCVGNPPRQTEDPASPPCVPYFQGDNFGATYQGVTKNDVNVLVYIDQGSYGSSAGSAGENTPAPGSYVDIDAPRLPDCVSNVTDNDPSQCDDVNTRLLKGFAHYFNDRYQTYGRHVHYWAYFTLASTPSQRRSDATVNWDRLHPFAVIDYAALRGNNDAYDDEMARLGVLVFASTRGSLSSAFYRTNAPRSWGFYPDIEHWAAMYSSYVCTKVAPFPVRRFGNPSGAGAPNGAKRRLGLWYTTDAAQPGLQLFAKLVKQQLKDCHANVVAEATYSHSGFAIDAEDNGADATQAVARFQAASVTTVLYMGGVESKLSGQADFAQYYPEIVVAGNLSTDSNAVGQAQTQNVWRNAWAMTFQVRMGRLQDTAAYRAYKEGDPSGDDVAAFYSVSAYPDHFMLFNAIQLAGPRLTPRSVDQGFHAINARPSTNPYVPALFFDPGDYTFVKDAAEEWWDSNGTPPATVGPTSSRPGCWRMARAGARSLAGSWAATDDVFLHASDPCTGYAGNLSYRAT